MGGGGGGVCFFFNDTATTEIYTLSLHDALPILMYCRHCLDNDLVAGADALAKVCADVGGRDCDLMTGRHDCYVCNGIAGRCPECADK